MSSTKNNKSLYSFENILQLLKFHSISIFLDGIAAHQGYENKYVYLLSFGKKYKWQAVT